MSDDWQRVSVQFSADISDLNRKMAKIESATNRAMKTLVTEARNASTQVNKIFDDLGRRASASIAAIGAAVGAKELMGLSDSWTTLNNKVAAVSQSTGMQARSMSDLVKGADDARSGIEAYTDLYTKLMRSASGVAKNEEEIARATNIVSKAFVAGGAAASEQAASILQLGQALSSGVLQGDELHSLRENAPLLAEAIAKEFNTTVGGLKELGAAGELVTKRVFKALLSAEQDIEKQFDATNATMEDGYKRIKNALMLYVGIGGQTSGINQSITQGLIMIADNFNKVADVAAIVSGVIAGQLVGRSLPALISKLALAGTATKSFIEALNKAKSLGGVLTAIGGASAPFAIVGAVLGGAVIYAMNDYMQKAAEAAARTERLEKAMNDLHAQSLNTAEGLSKAAKAVDELSPEQKTAKLNDIKKEYKEITEYIDGIAKKGSIQFILNVGMNANRPREIDTLGYREIAEATKSVTESSENYESAVKKINSIKINPDTAEDTKKFADEALEALKKFKYLPIMAAELGENFQLDEAVAQVDAFKQSLESLPIQDKEVIKYLQSLAEQLKEGGDKADEARNKLTTFANQNPSFISWFGQLDTLTEKIKTVIATAGALNQIPSQLAANKALNMTIYGGLDDRIKQNQEDTKAAKEVFDKMNRRNGMSASQIELDNEIDSIKKQLGVHASAIGDETITKQAKANIAARHRQADERKKPKKEKQNEYERLTQSMNDRIEVIKSETAATAQLNPLVNDYGYSLEKARKQQELRNAAIKSEIALTPEVLASIEQQASGYAKATSEQAKLAEQQENIRRRYEAIKDSSQDATHTFIDGMVRGEKAAKSFANSLSSIGQRLEDAGLNAIFNKLFDVTDNKPQSGGGLFGGVKKLFGFSSGGYTGDGGTYDAAGIVHRGEYVLSKQAVQNIGVGNLDTLHSLLKAPNGGYSLGNIAVHMPRTPSMSDLRALQTQKTEKERSMSIHVTPSKYFDVHVEEISGKVTSTGIQQYDKVLDNTLGAKLNNGRQMNRY